MIYQKRFGSIPFLCRDELLIETSKIKTTLIILLVKHK